MGSGLTAEQDSWPREVNVNLSRRLLCKLTLSLSVKRTAARETAFGRDAACVTDAGVHVNSNQTGHLRALWGEMLRSQALLLLIETQTEHSAIHKAAPVKVPMLSPAAESNPAT